MQFELCLMTYSDSNDSIAEGATMWQMPLPKNLLTDRAAHWDQLLTPPG